MRLGVAAAVVDGLLVDGDVVVEDGHVSAVGVAGQGTGIAVPGLVDLQVNGYAGVDALTADAEALRGLGRALARDGVLAYQPTLVSAPPDLTLAALGRLAEALPHEDGAARILGAHLEGPFLAPRRAGAHPLDCLRAPAPEAIAELLETACPVTTVTIAPELPGALDAIEALAARGALVSLGHSDATAPEAHAGFDRGARAVTHLFNAMRPFGHRDPGLVGAALARDDVTVMLIADGTHVAPEALLVAARAARGRVVLVSDAIAAAGLGDGRFTLGTTEVLVEGGESRRPDGTLAGAVLPLDRGIATLVGLGVPFVEAVEAATRAPAALVGRPEVSRLAVGAPADLVVLDEAGLVRRVVCGGVELER